MKTNVSKKHFWRRTDTNMTARTAAAINTVDRKLYLPSVLAIQLC